MIIFNRDIDFVIKFGDFYNPGIGYMSEFSILESYLKIFAQEINWLASAFNLDYFSWEILDIKDKKVFFPYG